MSGKIGLVLVIVILALVYFFVPGVKPKVNSLFESAQTQVEDAARSNEAAPEMDLPGDRVWWASNQSTEYHMDPNCPRLQAELKKANRSRGVPRPLSEAEGFGYRPCPECAKGR